jgi:hypothetical protein
MKYALQAIPGVNAYCMTQPAVVYLGMLIPDLEYAVLLRLLGHYIVNGKFRDGNNFASLRYGATRPT